MVTVLSHKLSIPSMIGVSGNSFTVIKIEELELPEHPTWPKSENEVIDIVVVEIGEINSISPDAKFVKIDPSLNSTSNGPTPVNVNSIPTCSPSQIVVSWAIVAVISIGFVKLTCSSIVQPLESVMVTVYVPSHKFAILSLVDPSDHA